MKFITVRDLRSRPTHVWKRLNQEENLVVTSNGRPVALLTSINDDSLEDTLAAIRRSRALMAVSRMQEESVAQGRDKISEEEIEAEIKAVRQGRKR
ncbi:MAG: hypothetical protein PWP65_1233 [Clostridia bacterium]|nr:hypothetical protein [Clostridia bacterium]